MPVIEQEERHVSRHLKGTGVMFESSHIKCVGRRNIEFRLLTHSSRIERWFHVKVMTIGRIILCPHFEHTH